MCISIFIRPSSPSSAQFVIEVVDAKDFNSINYAVRKNQTLYKNLLSNFIIINFKSVCHTIKNLFPTERKTSCYASSGSGRNASETNWVVIREENLYLKFWDANRPQIRKTTDRLSDFPFTFSGQMFYKI